MSDSDPDDVEPTMDVAKLIRMFRGTDRSALPPEIRERVERSYEAIKEMRAAGHQASPRDPRGNYPIGLDDNFNPFPTPLGQRIDANAEEGDGHDHD